MVRSDVHRRTGGLEKCVRIYCFQCFVHRRTGGLEIKMLSGFEEATVHRRTGGLETLLHCQLE